MSRLPLYITMHAADNVAILMHHRILIRRAVNNTGVLNIGAGLHDDAPEVPSQTGQRADVHALTNNDVTNQYSGRMNIGRGMNHGHQPINRINILHTCLVQKACTRSRPQVRPKIRS